ncbi:MAG: acyltransferase [Glaciimonas sp.]|nr:acyltransferase [Glaciimonas sp.]
MSFLKSVFRPFYYATLRIRDSLYCRAKIGIYKSSWRFWGLPLLSMHSGSKILIGDNFVACGLASRNSIGVNQKVIIKTTSPSATISIGDNVGMSGCSISASESISIGDGTLIGSGVLITDNDAHAVHPDLRTKNSCVLSRPVAIGRNVFVGARAIILKGVNIGDGSVIGAGSVVTKNIPEMSIAVGNPAVIVGRIKDVRDYSGSVAQ